MSNSSRTQPDANGAISLAGKVALVTGSSRGIGRAIALRLARMGAAIAICGRDAAALETVRGELRALGGLAFAQPADVTRTGDVRELVSRTESALGPISILVNNAGIGVFGPVQERTEQEWDAVLA